MFSKARDQLYSVLYPQLCICCYERPALVSDGNACRVCWARTEFFTDENFVCSKCGKPFSSPNAVQRKCWHCDGQFYDKARSIGIYSHALQAAVVGLKTHPHISKTIELHLLEAFERNAFANSTLIVPVPLSKQRKLERGFNQAEVIAERVGTTMKICVDSMSLARVKHSPIHRAGMDQKARDISVKDSFKVMRPKLVEGHRVLLVDDVLTTGATASYCAKALKKAGATEVNVLTLARAV